MRDEEEGRKILTTESPWRGEREREAERFPVGSFHRKSLVGRVEKKTHQKPTHTAAMTHLLFCSINTNVHALVVWRDLTYICAQQ